jgi:MshEN domain
MSERRTIGQILISVGRISEDDVARALEYQRDNGGYFGEALLACGLISAVELEWGLASQFDLPYVFPEADSVDPEAAALVSPEWALSHLTLPILKTARSLKVVVESPLNTAPVDELRERTDLEVELALASATTIRELIRQVYARGSAADEEIRAPLDFTEVLDAVLESDSPRFGISVRGARSSAWWDEKGTIRRRPLGGDWRSDLERLMTPAPSEMTSGRTRAEWEADVKRAGVATPVDVHYIADESGREYLFEPRHVESSSVVERFPPPSAGILSEVRLLARSGTARFIVIVDPPELGHEILPHLPTLLLDEAWRSIYINARDQDAAEEAFSLKVPSDSKTWVVEIEKLRAFHFDVVTADLSGGDSSWAGSALDIASVAFLLWQEEDDVRPAYEAGIRWQLRIAMQGGGHLEWSLEPLHA